MATNPHTPADPANKTQHCSNVTNPVPSGPRIKGWAACPILNVGDIYHQQNTNLPLERRATTKDELTDWLNGPAPCRGEAQVNKDGVAVYASDWNVIDHVIEPQYCPWPRQSQGPVHYETRRQRRPHLLVEMISPEDYLGEKYHGRSFQEFTGDRLEHWPSSDFEQDLEAIFSNDTEKDREGWPFTYCLSKGWDFRAIAARAHGSLDHSLNGCRLVSFPHQLVLVVDDLRRAARWRHPNLPAAAAADFLESYEVYCHLAEFCGRNLAVREASKRLIQDEKKQGSDLITWIERARDSMRTLLARYAREHRDWALTAPDPGSPIAGLPEKFWKRRKKEFREHCSPENDSLCVFWYSHTNQYEFRGGTGSESEDLFKSLARAAAKGLSHSSEIEPWIAWLNILRRENRNFKIEMVLAESYSEIAWDRAGQNGDPTPVIDGVMELGSIDDADGLSESRREFGPSLAHGAPVITRRFEGVIGSIRCLFTTSANFCLELSGRGKADEHKSLQKDAGTIPVKAEIPAEVPESASSSAMDAGAHNQPASEAAEPGMAAVHPAEVLEGLTMTSPAAEPGALPSNSDNTNTPVLQAAGQKGPPRRKPDLEKSRKRIELVKTLGRELATLKAAPNVYSTPDSLKRRHPGFKLWEFLDETDLKELADGKDFVPKAYAENLVLSHHNITSRETLKKDRAKLRRAGIS